MTLVDCDVYFAGKAYETRNPASGASSAGIRIIFARRREKGTERPSG